MTEGELKSLLAAGAADAPRRGADCPDEHRIAGYVDGALHEAARKQVELHLADCAHCLALVGLLSRVRESDAVEPVTGKAMARARALVERAPRRWWPPASQWAAAAALALVVPLLLMTSRNLERGVEGQGRPEPPATRTSASASGLQLLTPGTGAAVDPKRPSFHWTEVSGTPYYDVRIVTDAGDVVVQERVTGTAWQPSKPLNLRPGAEYFVHIDAYPSGDKTESSDHVPFRVSD